MHDLALHLGMTVETLANEMTGVEFNLWQKYAARRMLPWRRMELYLGQVAKLIAQTMGGASNAVLADFLFEPPDDDGAAVDEGGAEAFFGFNPRNKKE